MRPYALYIVAFVQALSCSVSNAFIYHAVVLKRWDSSLRDYQYVIGLSDFHTDIHAINSTQRAQLESMLFGYDPQKTAVIVEDLASKNEKGCSRCGPFFIKQGTGVLSGLARVCKQKQMSSCNVEYRYCRVASLAPLMAAGTNQANESPARHIRMSHVINEIKQVADDIRQYDDGRLLNQYYKKCVACAERKLAQLPNMSGDSQTVAEYVATHAVGEHKMDTLRSLCVLDSACIDAKIVHAIAHAPEKQVLIVVAGGTHIMNVAQQLKTQGYSVAKEIAGAVEHEHDLSKCIDLEIVQGRFCVRPQPIDLLFLHELKQELGI